MSVVPLESAANAELQETMPDLSQQRQARYEHVLDVGVSRRLILESDECGEDVVIEYFVVCSCQGCQVGLVHDVAEHSHRYLHCLGLYS